MQYAVECGASSVRKVKQAASAILLVRRWSIGNSTAKGNKNEMDAKEDNGSIICDAAIGFRHILVLLCCCTLSAGCVLHTTTAEKILLENNRGGELDAHN